MRGAASPEAAPGTPLHRDIDRNCDIGIPAVEQVVAVVDVADIDVVGVVPVIRPVFRPWVDENEPITTVLETRVSTYNQEGQSVHAEAMVWTKVSAEPIIRDAVTVVAATLLPTAVV